MIDVRGSRQRDEASCGPAVVEAVLRYWLGADKAPSQGELRGRLATTSAKGTEPSDIARVVREHGLYAETRRGMTLDELRSVVDRGGTVILLVQAGPDPGWDDGHYIVVKGIDSKRAHYFDPFPVRSNRIMPLHTLERRWRGIDEMGDRVSGLGIIVWG